MSEIKRQDLYEAIVEAETYARIVKDDSRPNSNKYADASATLRSMEQLRKKYSL